MGFFAVLRRNRPLFRRAGASDDFSPRKPPAALRTKKISRKPCPQDRPLFCLPKSLKKTRATDKRGKLSKIPQVRRRSGNKSKPGFRRLRRRSDSGPTLLSALLCRSEAKRHKIPALRRRSRSGTNQAIFGFFSRICRIIRFFSEYLEKRIPPLPPKIGRDLHNLLCFQLFTELPSFFSIKERLRRRICYIFLEREGPFG